MPREFLLEYFDIVGVGADWGEIKEKFRRAIFGSRAPRFLLHDKIVPSARTPLVAIQFAASQRSRTKGAKNVSLFERVMLVVAENWFCHVIPSSFRHFKSSATWGWAMRSKASEKLLIASRRVDERKVFLLNPKSSKVFALPSQLLLINSNETFSLLRCWFLRDLKRPSGGIETECSRGLRFAISSHPPTLSF